MPSIKTADADLEAEILQVRELNIDQLRRRWQIIFSSPPPEAFSKDLLARGIVWRLQEQALGGLDLASKKLLARLAKGKSHPEARRHLKAGTVLIREYQGERHTVTIAPGGFIWRETIYPSLTTIARMITGTAWNGPRFFGLRTTVGETDRDAGETRTARIKRVRSSPSSNSTRGREARQ